MQKYIQEIVKEISKNPKTFIMNFLEEEFPKLKDKIDSKEIKISYIEYKKYIKISFEIPFENNVFIIQFSNNNNFDIKKSRHALIYNYTVNSKKDVLKIKDKIKRIETLS